MKYTVQEKEEELTPIQGNKPMNRVALIMNHGVVEGLLADEEIEFLIVDSNTVGLDEEYIVTIPELANVESPHGEYYLGGEIAIVDDKPTLDAIFEADRKRFEG